MKFSAPLIAVKDIEISKKFYTEVLHQKIILDFGENVVFDGSFSIQSGFAELVGFDVRQMVSDSKNFELYFEEENLDDFVTRLHDNSEIKYVHQIKEYGWGQRVIRFFDPDMHMIEVGESMDVVIKRFLKQGLSIEETAQRTQHPIEYVRNCL